MRPFAGLRFENSYAGLHPDFYQAVEPTPLPDPRLAAFNPDAAALIDLDPAQAGHPDAARLLSGSLPIPGAAPIAQAYAGHQFGVWVPQLGDGRAFLLGEVRNSRGESWDLHLKGGGQTRWSRFGDGRSVLRSAVREYLACEALHALDIPTTRALSIVASDLPVQRESLETAAAIIRLAPSHVRFGTFEYFAARGAVERVRELADYVIERHYGDLSLRCAQGDSFAQGDTSARDDHRRYCAFFGEVCRRTGRLIARWMAAGFAHGVMNTDNMSILGITLDYGPYGFLDDYEAGFICNHTDTEGQYAFDRQPSVGIWNCARLGEALMILDGGAGATAPWQDALESYWPAFVSEYAERMRARLGLAGARDEDGELLRDLLALLQAGRVDYTRFFRALNSVNGERSTVNGGLHGMFVDRTGFDTWLDRYRARLRAEASDDRERVERMRRANPKYLLRNWVAQEAIAAAQRGEFGLIDSLRRLLAAPYDEHPGWERYAGPPGAADREIEVSCSS